ncbi:hypothetical protein QEN19_002677 [Hanseniaspora menglaensis]
MALIPAGVKEVSKSFSENIFEEQYKSKNLFKQNFFGTINNIVSDKPEDSKVNLYIPQSEALYILNSYVNFDELSSKLPLNSVYTELGSLDDKNAENIYNLLLLDYTNIPDSLNYDLINEIKLKWHFISDVVVLGDSSYLESEEEAYLLQMKKQAIKNIYQIPLNVILNIEFLMVPMWRIADGIFSVKFKQEDHEYSHLRPINVDNSMLLKNLKNWMHLNKIRGINKIIACEKNSEGTALKLMSMIENDVEFFNTDQNLLFDIKKDCNVFIFDRSVDTITPLLTELTYIGLLNEQDFSFIKEIISKENNNGSEINDNIFENLKFLNFGEVGSVLQRLLSSYGKATNTRDYGGLKSGGGDHTTSEELNRMIKILSDKDVISNSKNLPKHVNKASELMSSIKDINYSLDDLIEIESLLLSEWNHQSQYLNNSSKLKFNWSKLSSGASSVGTIIDDSFIVEWIEEQNFVGNYTFAKLLKIVVLYNSLYGPFNKTDIFYDRLLVSFSDRFGSALIAPVFENLFTKHQIILGSSSKNSGKTLANTKSQITTIENNRRMLKLLDYLNYIPNVSNEGLLTSAINDTISKTANVVGLAFLNPFGGSDEKKQNTKGTINEEEPLSFAYCGVTPIITRFLQYALTINPVNPSLLTLGVPSDLIEDVASNNDNSVPKSVYEKQTISSSLNEAGSLPSALLKVRETHLLKSRIGMVSQKDNMMLSKSVVLITGGVTLSEMATIDRLNKLILNVFNKASNPLEDGEKKSMPLTPIAVIADKII